MFFIRLLVAPRAWCSAAGANVGLASIFFELETDAPDALQLYAFEPLPTNRNALRRNLYS